MLAQLEQAQKEKQALVDSAQDSVDDVNSQIATRQKESAALTKLIQSMQTPSGGTGTGIMAWPCVAIAALAPIMVIAPCAARAIYILELTCQRLRAHPFMLRTVAR